MRLNTLIAALEECAAISPPSSPILPELVEVIHHFLQDQNLRDELRLELEALQKINNREAPTAGVSHLYRHLAKRIRECQHQHKSDSFFSNLKASASPCDSQILSSIQSPDSGRSLTLDPRDFPLQDTAFLLHAHRRLLIASPHEQLCSHCGRPFGKWNEHIATCSKIGYSSKHNHAVRRIFFALRSILSGSAIQIRREENVSQFLKPEQRHKVKLPRVDIIVYLPHGQKQLWIDLTMPAFTDKHTKETPLASGERAKFKHYNERYNIPTYVEVIPAVIDSYGNCNELFKKKLQEICSRLVPATSLRAYNFHLAKLRGVEVRPFLNGMFRKCFLLFHPSKQSRAFQK
jgi:hypothetical protein